MSNFKDWLMAEEGGIVCPHCNSKSWDTESKSPVEPSKDRFVCKACNKKFARYQGTKYEKDGDPKYEGSTSTACVAGFARRTIPMVNRHWGIWSEEDPFFKKKKKKKVKNESTSTADVAVSHAGHSLSSDPTCPSCKKKSTNKELTLMKKRFGREMCGNCASSLAASS